MFIEFLALACFFSYFAFCAICIGFVFLHYLFRLQEVQHMGLDGTLSGGIFDTAAYSKYIIFSRRAPYYSLATGLYKNLKNTLTDKCGLCFNIFAVTSLILNIPIWKNMWNFLFPDVLGEKWILWPISVWRTTCACFCCSLCKSISLE